MLVWALKIVQILKADKILKNWATSLQCPTTLSQDISSKSDVRILVWGPVLHMRTQNWQVNFGSAYCNIVKARNNYTFDNHFPTRAFKFQIRHTGEILEKRLLVSQDFYDGTWKYTQCFHLNDFPVELHSPILSFDHYYCYSTDWLAKVNV